MNENQLPDTPWHIGYAKKEESDPRRHKSRCIYYVDGECRCGKSQCYMQRCGGSSHCMTYAEKTESERIADNYKAVLMKKKSELTKANNNYSYRKTKDLHECLVCSSSLENKGFSLKKCSYCGMYYVNVEHYTRNEVLDIVKADDVFLMNLSKKKKK